VQAAMLALLLALQNDVMMNDEFFFPFSCHEVALFTPD